MIDHLISSSRVELLFGAWRSQSIAEKHAADDEKLLRTYFKHKHKKTLESDANVCLIEMASSFIPIHWALPNDFEYDFHWVKESMSFIRQQMCGGVEAQK